MEAQRCSVSLSVLFLAVLLDSGAAGRSHSAGKLQAPGALRAAAQRRATGEPTCWKAPHGAERRFKAPSQVRHQTQRGGG